MKQFNTIPLYQYLFSYLFICTEKHLHKYLCIFLSSIHMNRKKSTKIYIKMLKVVISVARIYFCLFRYVYNLTFIICINFLSPHIKFLCFWNSTSHTTNHSFVCLLKYYSRFYLHNQNNVVLAQK